jgi:hypothetical protein
VTVRFLGWEKLEDVPKTPTICPARNLNPKRLRSWADKRLTVLNYTCSPLKLLQLPKPVSAWPRSNTS